MGAEQGVSVVWLVGEGCQEQWQVEGPAVGMKWTVPFVIIPGCPQVTVLATDKEGPRACTCYLMSPHCSA